MRRRALCAALAGTAVVALVACSAPASEGSPSAAEESGPPLDLAEIERLAKEEGEVVWYSGALPATSDSLIAAFEDRYGIDVVFPGRMSSTELGTRVQTDVRNSGVAGADVIGPQPDDALMLYMADNGISAPLPTEVFEGVDAEFYIGDSAAVMCQIQIPVIGLNLDRLDGFVPSSWEDLLDPRLRGQIMVADPRGTATWLRVWSAILNAPDLGEEYIDQIVAQDFQPVTNSLVAAEQLIAGQGAVQIAGIPTLFEPAKEEGQPIDFWVPEDPALVSPNYCAVTEGTEHPNAGLLFLHWLMSEEGQTILNGVERSASPLGDVPGAFPLPEDAVFPGPPDQLRNELPLLTEKLGFN